MSITKAIPNASEVEGGKATYEKSLEYMGYKEGEQMVGKPIDYVFIGSCNGRMKTLIAFTVSSRS